MELPAPPKALSGDVVQPDDERILEQDFVAHPLISDPIIDAEFVEGAAAENAAGFEEPLGAGDASTEAPTQSADPIIDLSESLEVAEIFELRSGQDPEGEEALSPVASPESDTLETGLSEQSQAPQALEKDDVA